MNRVLAARKILSASFYVALLLCLLPSYISPTSAQFAWTKYTGNPVLDKGAPGKWDDLAVWDPSVIFEPTGNYYRMYYTGTNTANPDKRQIGYAGCSSLDGVTWIKVGTPVLTTGSPGAFDEVWAGNPSVLRLTASVYYMWYSGRDAAGTVKIGRATSIMLGAGIVWTKTGVVLTPGPNDWDASRVHAPCVLYNPSWDPPFKMWYTGYDSNLVGRIGYAHSEDGINWVKYPPPVLDLGPPGAWDSASLHDPTVIFDGSMLHMWYGGTDENGIGRIGYATSTDLGFHWTKWEMVLDIGPPGSWEDGYIMGPTVLYKDGFYNIWYAGKGPYNRIGYAVSRAMPLSSVQSFVINAAAGSVYFIFANPYRMVSPPPTPWQAAFAAYDVTAGGIIYGLCLNEQVICFDSNPAIVVAKEPPGSPPPNYGEVLLSGKSVVLMGGPVPNWAVDYYERTGQTPLKLYRGATDLGFQTQGGTVVYTIPNTTDFTRDDLFVVMFFEDTKGNSVLIIYGMQWAGTFAGGIFFKEYIKPNLASYTGSAYVFDWGDYNGDKVPDASEITQVYPWLG